MSEHETQKNPPFRYEVQASGLGEVWTQTHDNMKFTQFGWRCSNKESSYDKKTLIGNWCETRFNIHSALENKPLPSQFSHYFETTAKTDYEKDVSPVGLDNSTRRQKLKRMAGTEAMSFPGHQPELDHPLDKELYNSFITTSRTGYLHPALRKAPLPIAKPSE